MKPDFGWLELVETRLCIMLFAGEMMFSCIRSATTRQPVAKRKANAQLRLIACEVGLHSLCSYPIRELVVISHSSLAAGAFIGSK